MFRNSDYLYLLIMNAVMLKASAYEKFTFLKNNIYRKGKGFSIAKAIVSASYSEDEYEMFSNIVNKLYEHRQITPRKRQELMHIIELKYRIPQKTDIELPK